MIKKIIRHIEYRKKVKILRMYTVNQLTNLLVSKGDYVLGFQELLLTASKSDNAEELQKMLNDFMDLANRTKNVNDVVNKSKSRT